MEIKPKKELLLGTA